MAPSAVPANAPFAPQAFSFAATPAHVAPRPQMTPTAAPAGGGGGGGDMPLEWYVLAWHSFSSAVGSAISCIGRGFRCCCTLDL